MHPDERGAGSRPTQALGHDLTEAESQVPEKEGRDPSLGSTQGRDPEAAQNSDDNLPAGFFPRGTGRKRPVFVWARRVFEVAVLGGTVWVALRHESEIVAAGHLLRHTQIDWFLVALGCQLSSMVAFGRLQWWLLRSGGVEVRTLPMVEIAFAGNALGTSLPGGPAWSAAWVFTQLRKRGADRVLAGWVVFAASLLSGFGLFLMADAGAFLAGSSGPVSALRPLAGAMLGAVLVGGVTAWGVARSDKAREVVSSWALAISEKFGWQRRISDSLTGLLRRVRAVRPSPWGWFEAFWLALGQWAGDAATLSFCILALHAPFDWAGILVVYSVTQLAATLPITPGGVGIVEGTLVALLSAYGMSTHEALAVTILYRVISFWGMVPLGWILWIALELAARGGVRHRPHPWAAHHHGEHSHPDYRRHGPSWLLGSRTCEYCEEQRRQEAEAAARAASRDKPDSQRPGSETGGITASHS